MSMNILDPNKKKVDRLNPFISKIKDRFSLTKEGSTKKTYHLSLELKDSGLEFKVGDSVAIYAENNPLSVEKILTTIKATGNEIIKDPRSEKILSLREFITTKTNLSRIDFLKELNTKNTPLEELCKKFSPLLPRFYSIASSLKEHPDEVHLTVALSQYEENGQIQYGVASHFLCHLAKKEETPIPLYVQSAKDFTLPEDHNTPIIMIGPGTGVAPFRAFMQERLKLEAQGKHWLFFGERNRASDFLYEDFWLSAESQGKLRLDLAFSRDQEEKHYVQHKIYHQGQGIWEWIQEGAILYVCGDADPMAKDVEATLHQIAKEKGSMQDDEAKAFLKALRKEKRLLFDVY